MAAAASAPLIVPSSSAAVIMLPYANKVFNEKMLSIISLNRKIMSKFIQLGASLRDLKDFSELQQSLPRTIEEFQKALKNLPQATEHDNAPLGADSAASSSCLQRVVYFIILINNNRKRDGEILQEHHYCCWFNMQLDSGLFDPWDVQFCLDDWIKAIDDLQQFPYKNKVFISFPDFVNHKKLKSVENFPICNESRIICNSESEFPLGFGRTLNPGTWINSSSLLLLTSAGNTYAQNPSHLQNDLFTKSDANTKKAKKQPSHDRNNKQAPSDPDDVIPQILMEAARNDSSDDDEDDDDDNNDNKNNNKNNENVLDRAVHPTLDDEILMKFRADVTNFIGGESGSGKTTAAVLAGGKTGVTLYYVPRDVYGHDIDHPRNDRAAKMKFVSWVASILGLRPPLSLPTNGDLPSIVFAGDVVDDVWTSLVVPWRNIMHDTKVLLVFDELGDLENVRHAFCCRWPTVFRSWLARLLCLANKQHLYFTIVGTSVEFFEKTPGSLPATYQVFTVRAPKLFAELLVGTSSSNLEDREMKQLSHEMLELLYRKSAFTRVSSSPMHDEYDPNPTCPATYRFLQLVSNPRCASLAIDYMRTIAAWRLPSTKNWTSRSVRSNLQDLSFEIATKFCKMNGLSKFEDKTISLIGSALYCVLSKATTFTESQRKVLSKMTGLLSDTGFLMKERDFNEFEKKPNNPFERATHVDPLRQPGEDDAEEKYVYVFRRGSARFRMSKAHVALLLLAEGSDNCGHDVVVASDWKIFEAATADYIMLCWILNIPAPQTTTFPIYRKNKIFFSPCYPEFSYTLDVAQTPTNVYRGILQFGLSDTTLKMKEQERVTWLDNLKTNWTKLIQEGGGLVFENGGGAAFADVIAVFQQRIIIVQCKYKTKPLTVEDTQEACDTLVVHNSLTLAWLAECAGAKNGSASCHLVVVLAAGFPKTLHADTQKDFVSRGMSSKNELPSHFNREKLRVEVTVAFPSDKESNQISCLFPVLQYPYDDQAAMETAIDINCDGGLMSKHVALGSPTTICNEVLFGVQ